MKDYWADSRFADITPWKKVCLSSLTMQSEEKKQFADTIDTNWATTICANLNEVEKLISRKNRTGS